MYTLKTLHIYQVNIDRYVEQNSHDYNQPPTSSLSMQAAESSYQS